MPNCNAAEERQEQNAKRRKVEQQRAKEREQDAQAVEVTPLSTATAPGGAHPLPSRPSFDVFTGASLPSNPTFAGSNSDVVANRAALRLANLSAAEAMRAELAGAAPLKPTSRATLSGARPSAPEVAPLAETVDVKPEIDETVPPPEVTEATNTVDEDVKPEPAALDTTESAIEAESAIEDLITNAVNGANEGDQPRGVKRSAEEMEKEDGDSLEEEEATAKRALKVNPDGTVEQEDTVKYVLLVLIYFEA
jgi:5'-3' exoribonuclease 2